MQHGLSHHSGWTYRMCVLPAGEHSSHSTSIAAVLLEALAVWCVLTSCVSGTGKIGLKQAVL